MTGAVVVIASFVLVGFLAHLFVNYLKGRNRK
jgi:hypothetical protein